MKYLIFVSAIFMTSFAYANLKIDSISGLESVQLVKNKIQSIEVDLASAKKLQFVFTSSDKIGTPRFIYTSELTDMSIVVGYPILQVKVPVTLMMDMNDLCILSGEERVFKIGIDGNNDGDLLDSDDDSYTIMIRAL